MRAKGDTSKRNRGINKAGRRVYRGKMNLRRILYTVKNVILIALVLFFIGKLYNPHYLCSGAGVAYAIKCSGP